MKNNNRTLLDSLSLFLMGFLTGIILVSIAFWIFSPENLPL
jgi:hypothetical protein